MDGESDGERQVEILEVFTEAGEQPSHVRERRIWRAAVKAHDKRRAKIEENRIQRFTDRFLRRSLPPVEPLPRGCYCSRPNCFHRRSA